jgi:hypothetical protein
MAAGNQIDSSKRDMAERRRKSVAGYKRISNCLVHPDCWIKLHAIAGDDGLGYAIEQLCERESLLLAILDSNLPAEQRAAAARDLISGRELLKSSV